MEADPKAGDRGDLEIVTKQNVRSLLLALPLSDEALEFVARHEPAGLAADAEALEFARAQVAPDCLDAQVQLRRHVANGQESFGIHHHDVTKHITNQGDVSRYVAKSMVE